MTRGGHVTDGQAGLRSRTAVSDSLSGGPVRQPTAGRATGSLSKPPIWHHAPQLGAPTTEYGPKGP